MRRPHWLRRPLHHRTGERQHRAVVSMRGSRRIGRLLRPAPNRYEDEQRQPFHSRATSSAVLLTRGESDRAAPNLALSPKGVVAVLGAVTVGLLALFEHFGTLPGAAAAYVAGYVVCSAAPRGR